MRLAIVAATLSFALAAPNPVSAQTSCGQYNFAVPFAAAFLAGEPFEEASKAAETITTIADGACHQDALLKALKPQLGEVVGYKAAATSEGAQKQLGLDGPVLGIFLEKMLLDSGATVKVDDGARLIFELDLLVRVADPALGEAQTREEALAGIDAVIPFIELGDLMAAKGAAITGPLVQAMNAGARFGIVGEPIATTGMTAESLAGSSGQLLLDGAVVAEAPATALLGHPLDAVLWVAQATNSRGMALKKGDVLSLGSLGRFQLAAPGVVDATYEFGDLKGAANVTLE
ncbi:MAG: hydratase [Pseudomonadota bacterium]